MTSCSGTAKSSSSRSAATSTPGAAHPCLTRRGRKTSSSSSPRTIGKKPFVDTYKSDVRYKKKDDLIHVTNIGGPLKHLENNWKFVQKENFTEVHFDVDFEIKNKFLDMIMTKSFEFGLNKIADAFQKKAENL